MGTDSNASTPKVQKHVHRRHRVTRSLKGPDCWVWSPGNVQFLRQAEWYLEDVNSMNGGESLDVTHIQVGREAPQLKLYLWPVPKTDLDALELKRINGNLWVNLGPFLAECNLMLPANTKERFHLVVVPAEQTPEGIPNALCLDLDSPLERRRTGRRRGKKESARGQARTDETQS